MRHFDEWLSEGGEGSSKPKRSSRAVGSSKEKSSKEKSSKEKSSKVVGGRKQAEMFPVGSYVAVVYDGDWYVAQVEGEEPEGYTLLKYMERKGNNQFVWGSGKDTLKTINKDILCIADPPILCRQGCGACLSML
jgi:hypothetical protein